MPKPSLIAVTVLALALVSFAWAPVAQACKCMMPSPEDARDAAEAVFEGRVVKVDMVKGEADGMGTKRATLKVVRSWKGSNAAETLVVDTAESSAACGVDFDKDVSYFVYAIKNEKGELLAGSCGRTRPMEAASDDLAALGAGVTPVKVEPRVTSAQNASHEKDIAPAPKSGGCASNASASAGMSALLFFPALGGLLVARRRRR
jgi:hypothetical protein